MSETVGPNEQWVIDHYGAYPQLLAKAREQDAERAALEQAVADEHAENLALRDNCTALATDKMRLRQRVVQIVRVCESDPTKSPVRQFAAQVLALCVAALGDEPDALEQRVRELAGWLSIVAAAAHNHAHGLTPHFTDCQHEPCTAIQRALHQQEPQQEAKA